MPESTEKRALKVFLSYASQDRLVVRELSLRLANEGWIDPWLDEKKLLPGQDWRTKIEEAVETSDIVIICLSSNSVSKEGFVQKELRYAREIAFEKPDETIFLIPLRLDDCETPRGLRFYQWGDYFGDKKEETYAALLESLKLRYEQKLKIEAEERARKEKAEKERIALEEKARKEAQEKARLEAEERARQEKEEREHKAAQIHARKEAEEKAYQEAKERARIEREENERKVAEITAQKKAKSETAKMGRREKAKQRALQLAVLKNNLSKSFALFSNFAKSLSKVRTLGYFIIAIALIWIGTWEVPKLFTIAPTSSVSVTPTPRPNAMATSTLTRPSPTKTATKFISATSTKVLSPTPSYLSPAGYNLDFEQVGSGWLISRSNIYFIGGPSQEWASNGSWSYRLTHFKVDDPGCSIYAYPGDFVQITRRVDLSNVTGIVLDLKCITCANWDGRINGMHVEVRIDKKSIGMVDNIPNELLNYVFPIVNMPGSHLLSVRLVIDREACYTVETGIYVDNIRFDSSLRGTTTPTP